MLTVTKNFSVNDESLFGAVIRIRNENYIFELIGRKGHLVIKCK